MPGSEILAFNRCRLLTAANNIDGGRMDPTLPPVVTIPTSISRHTSEVQQSLEASLGPKLKNSRRANVFCSSLNSGIHQGDSYVSFGGGRRSQHPWDRRNPHKPRHHKLIAEFLLA